jgi:hypothetical protein
MCYLVLLVELPDLFKDTSHGSPTSAFYQLHFDPILGLLLKFKLLCQHLYLLSQFFHLQCTL